MTKQKSLGLLERMGKFGIIELDIPTPGPGELLVQIRATALNPVDWKLYAEEYFANFVQEYPAVLGTDSAGVVYAVGEGVTGFSVGDRVLHQGWFSNKSATFQQYAIVPAEITAKLPDSITFDQAATIPLTMATAALALYNKKQQPFGGAALTPPWVEGGRGKYAGQPIVITGGSTSVGQHVIQFAKLSGFSPIITTASLQHDAYLKSLGATHTIDRHQPLSALPEAVRAITSVPVKLVYDTISEGETTNTLLDVLAPGGQVIVTLNPSLDQAKFAGKELVHVFGNVHQPAQRETGVQLYKHLTPLLEAGDIKPNKVELLPNGLNGIPDGLEKLRSGKVSASKLVARPQETA